MIVYLKMQEKGRKMIAEKDERNRAISMLNAQILEAQLSAEDAERNINQMCWIFNMFRSNVSWFFFRFLSMLPLPFATVHNFLPSIEEVIPICHWQSTKRKSLYYAQLKFLAFNATSVQPCHSLKESWRKSLSSLIEAIFSFLRPKSNQLYCCLRHRYSQTP